MVLGAGFYPRVSRDLGSSRSTRVGSAPLAAETRHERTQARLQKHDIQPGPTNVRCAAQSSRRSST